MPEILGNRWIERKEKKKGGDDRRRRIEGWREEEKIVGIIRKTWTKTRKMDVKRRLDWRNRRGCEKKTVWLAEKCRAAVDRWLIRNESKVTHRQKRKPTKETRSKGEGKHTNAAVPFGRSNVNFGTNFAWNSVRIGGRETFHERRKTSTRSTDFSPPRSIIGSKPFSGARWNLNVKSRREEGGII